MSRTLIRGARLVYPDRVEFGDLAVDAGRIAALGTIDARQGDEVVALDGDHLAPGFVDLHVHGGDGADFMDLTEEAFRTVAHCHARHGTTAMTPTSTVATRPAYRRFLELCRQFGGTVLGGARLLGGHLYGPWFLPAARGCHPDAEFLTPDPARDVEWLDFVNHGLATLTIAPELSGAETLVRAAAERGLLVTAGHTHATFDQMAEAVRWGVGHVDHLFCAMSDRARLRPSQAYPMRGGVVEATLLLDELTTEVIADGRHLSPELLRLAFKCKGPDRLALVTDAMRAVDLPDGEYWFGPTGSGERVRKLDGVGVTLDGKSLASGAVGLDECVRNFHRDTGAPLHEVVRMASLTPARILGRDGELGSLAVGKLADLVVLDAAFRVRQVYVGGARVA